MNETKNEWKKNVYDDEDEMGNNNNNYYYKKKRTKRVLTGVEYCKYVINTCWPVSWRCPVHEN